MLRLACASVLLLASPARADTEGFIGGGMALGMAKFFSQAFVAEGGVRPVGGPLWLHAAVAGGNGGDAAGSGGYWHLVAGPELLQCTDHAGACLLLGIDLGFASQTWSSGNSNDFNEHHEGFYGASRVGIDTGSARVRFRAEIELTQFWDHSNVAIPTWELGFATSIGIAYRL